MTLNKFILADVSTPFLDLPPENREAFFVFAAFLLIITLLICWILFFRNPSRRRRHHKHSRKETRPVANQLAKSEAEVAPTKRRRRVRRSNHPQRPINPTLAQTRGLPPLKTMQQDSNSSF